MNHEGFVSSILRSLETNEIRLAGFDFRIKSQSSLARKIRTDAVLEGVSEEHAAQGINDVLRYTYVSPDKSFVEEFVRIRKLIEAEGYNLVEVRNTLKLRKNGYRGVNTKVEAPDGYIFELQFHTQASLDVKENLNHPLYEKARLAETSAAEREKLTRKMVENSTKIPTPPGIDKVEL